LLEANKHLHNGWAIPGIGGMDMVIGAAGTMVALAGGGMPGMAILIGGGAEIIGGAGYQAGAPTLIRTDPHEGFEDSASLFFLNQKLSEFFSPVRVPCSIFYNTEDIMER
jgi:hypothetical protein